MKRNIYIYLITLTSDFMTKSPLSEYPQPTDPCKREGRRTSAVAAKLKTSYPIRFCLLWLC